MKMTTRIAYDNMRYHKTKNILTGIAIILTTLLLFVIPTVGKDLIDVQSAAVNQLYPSWHALYRNVDEEMVRKLAVHHDIEKYGLRSDVGIIDLEDTSAAMLYLDEEGMALYKLELAEGDLPEQDDEIVVSPGILDALGVQGDIGDTIMVPYQIYRNESLDYIQQKEFRICGFLEDSEQKVYTALISEAFLKNEIPEGQITYRFVFQVNDMGSNRTDELEETIKNIAEQFQIPEDDTNINEEYLGANYVDPTVIPVIIAIMVIIMFAGVITIYSIYYVSMNQRIQEFGRLKAIGATRGQIRQIVLREGFCVAALAIPAGLLVGTLISKIVLLEFSGFADRENGMRKVLDEIIRNDEIPLYHWWIYLLTIAVTLGTVYLSLLRPMHMAAKVSEIEAMRYQGTDKRRRVRRKRYEYLTIGRLTSRNLFENKKKSLVTILSMSVTGIFVMVIATILSCANPTESADASIVGQYEISPIIENGNKEHPEREWSEVQKNNPLSEELKLQIEQLDGVERIDIFTVVRVSGGPFDEEDYNAINGVPKEYAKEIERGITEGKVTYEELKSGDKVIVDRALLYWYPDLKIGDKLNLTIYDADRTYEKEIEIAAIGEYGSGFTNYNYLIMAKEAADKLCGNNAAGYFHVIADKKYDKILEGNLKEIVAASGSLQMRTWQSEYDQWEMSMTITSGACYAFLGILAVISVMNLINTMINSVHVRKKELGMMQAIGMSDGQLMKLLQLEGLFYTLGTLMISVGIGSLAGYPVFLYAKRNGMFNMTTYHYPVTVAVIVTVVLLLIQLILAFAIVWSVKKDSLIERVRFSE